MKFDRSYIENEIFATGDIFWNKKSGIKVLISKKNDLINFELIDKLISGNMDLSIENWKDMDFLNQIHSWFKSYSEELEIRKKIIIKDKITRFLVKEFVKDDKEQFQLDVLGWKLFGKLPYLEIQEFIKTDFELLKMNLRICSTMSICSFLIGNYSEKYLIANYNDCLIALMNFTSKSRERSYEYLFKPELSKEDLLKLKALVPKEVLDVFVVFEKKNGSGPQEKAIEEMSDVESLFLGIFHFYLTKNENHKNIFQAFLDDDIQCVYKVNSIIKKEIEKVLLFNLENAA